MLTSLHHYTLTSIDKGMCLQNIKKKYHRILWSQVYKSHEYKRFKVACAILVCPPWIHSDWWSLYLHNDILFSPLLHTIHSMVNSQLISCLLIFSFIFIVQRIAQGSLLHTFQALLRTQNNSSPCGLFMELITIIFKCLRNTNFS